MTTFRFLFLLFFLTGLPFAQTISVTKGGDPVQKNGTITLPNTVTIGNSLKFDLLLAEEGEVNVAWNATLNPSSDFSLSSESGVINNDGGAATLEVVFNPRGNGQQEATLTILTRDSRNDPDPENDEAFTINLTGKGLLPAEVMVKKNSDVIESGSSVTFSEIDRSGSTTSEDLEFTISNVGEETLTIGTIEFDPPGGPFSLIETPGDLVGSANGALTVRFTPTTTGDFSTSLKINSNDEDKAPFIVNLEGSAIAPQFGFKDQAGNPIAGGVTQEFDDAIIADGTVAGEVREVAFSVHQLGDGDLNWNAALTNSDHFQIVGNSSGTISAAIGPQSQDLVIRFAPTVEGDLTSTLTITSNDPDSPSYQLAITGTGLAPAEIEVVHESQPVVNGGTLDFDEIDLQSASMTRTLTLRITNLGDEPLTIPTELTDFRIEADPSSSIPDEFKVIEPLPISLLSKDESTSLLIRFEPQEPGQRSATLSFANNDRSRTPFTVQLKGEATRPAILVRTPGGRVTSTRSPSSFGFTPLGNSSTIEFTIENPGTAPVQDLSVALSESEHYTISQNISENVLEAGGSAKFTVTFTPSTSSLNLQDSVIVSGSNVNDWEFAVTGDSSPPADSQPDKFGYFYQKEIALTSDFLAENGSGVSEVSLTTDSVQSINIGFPFKFYENTYGVCSVSKKGLVTFENDKSVYRSPHQLPTPGIQPSNLIAPFWANLTTRGDSKILYATRGVSPGRVFNVQYTNFYLGNSNTKITFSVLLFEGTNSIEFHYREIIGSISSTPNKVSVGIQNKNGDSGVGYWFGQLDGTPAPGFDQDGFIDEFPSAIKFVRPIKARVVSAYRGRANDGTRIRCDSTSGLEEGMFVQAIDSAGLLLEGTKILEIIDHQTIRVNQAPTRDEVGVSIEATSYDPRLGFESPEPIRYSQNFDGFGNGTRDLNDDSEISGPAPQVDNGRLYLTYDQTNPAFPRGGGRSSFSIPALAGSSEGFEASFDFSIMNSGGNPADGFSLNYGNALLGALGSEEGMQGNAGVTDNLSFEVDTYRLGSSELGVGISGIVDGVTQSNWAFTNGPILKTETVTGRATFSWNPQNGASFTTTGLLTDANFSNVPVGGFEGNDSFTFNISARIGGANQTLSIDNLEIVTSGSPQIVDPRIKVVISNCSTDISSSGMLTSVGYPFINSSGGLEVTDLGFDPLPGEIYTFPHGEEQTFVSPPTIYLNKNYEPLTEPGTPPLIVDASSLPDDVAVYRLVTDGYSVAGQVVQGANTSFSEILEEDVTVVWRWKLEYAVFIQTASTLNGAPVSLQGGVGNPSPGVGRHWVSANQDFTASIDREIGEGILGSAPTGFRYSTQEYSIGYQGDFSGSSRVSAGNDGNQITTAPITIDNWASVRWHTKAQVLYQFDAKRLSGTESDDDFLGHSFIRVKDSNITKTLVAVESLDQTIRIPVPFFTSDDLTVTNKTSAEPLTAEDDYIAIPGTPAGNNNGAIRLIGSRKVKIGDLLEIEASAENTTYFGHNALNRQWINIGAEVCVGAFYRTEDRCFTLGDFTSRPGGDLGALGLDSTELKDAIFRENGYLHSANSQPRVARVFKVAKVQRPTEVHFVYEPTIYRVELPFGKFFDASNPNLQLVPDFCEGMALRTNSEGPSDQHTASFNDSSGGAVGLPYRWDQLGKRLFPVHPGTFEIRWPDAIDQEKVHRIEVVAGYPNNTVDLVSAREEESGLRQTTTGLSTEDLIETGFSGVVDSEESDHVFETDLPAVSSDFPGSQPDGLDAHYRYLRDNNQERQAPTKLDLATTDQWKFTQMPYHDNGARVDEASDGIPFSADEDGRCVLLYSYRPNPDEVATGDLTKESLAVRVVRSEELDPLLPQDPRHVLGTYGLILDGSKNLGIVERRDASQTIDPGNEFVLDFWLNASGFASDDGEVSLIATRGDNLKVTLDNNLSLKDQAVSGPTDSIVIPFSFTEPGQVRVSNLTSGLTLESTIDYDASPGSPQGIITLLGTEKVSPGDTIRVALIESRAPAPAIRATYRGVTVSHDFETVGPRWRHYLVHVFTNEFLGLSTTSIHFYADGKLEHTARMTSQLTNGSAAFEVNDKVDSSSLRLGQGAEASSRLLLDQLRIYKPNSSVFGETSWLSSGEINKLRNERNPILRGADPELWFSFEADPTSDTGTGVISFIEGQDESLARMGIGPITAETGGNSGSDLYRSIRAKALLQEVATRVESPLDNAGFDGSGYILNRVSNYNAKIYDRDAEVGFWGTVYPVNHSRVYDSTNSLEVAYYENYFRNDEFLHPNVAWPYVSAVYQQVVYPQEGPHARNAVYIASRLGSEGVDRDGRLQKVYRLDHFANLTIYNQPSRTEAGFNPNEEHAIAAPSNRAALKIKEKGETLPNNPPLAAFALQADNNTTTGANYTSEPWVLVQFDNLKTGEKEMSAYYVARERIGPLGIGTFPRISDEVVNETEGLAYESAPNPEDRFLTLDPSKIYNFRYAFDYKVNAGDLMIPPYPLNLVIGNTPMPASGGGNDASQRTVWADVNGNHWVVSGGGRFTFKYFYPFRDDFYLNSRPAKGAPVPWVPDADASGLRSFSGSTENLMPGRISYSSYWATDYPKIKRGETLTYQGGEYFNENPGAEGLPALVAMAAAEIVYDSGTPSMVIGEDNINNYSARIIRPLDRYESPFTVAQMDTAGFSPASPKISVIAERWYFTDLPGSLQARFYFDSLAEKLVFRGYLNGKDSGDPDLTAGPDPLNLLEPSLLTDDEKTQLDSLAEDDAEWKAAVRTIFERAKNPMLIRNESTTGNEPFTGRYLSGMKEAPIVTQRIGLNLELAENRADVEAQQARLDALRNQQEELEGQRRSYNDVQEFFSNLFSPSVLRDLDSNIEETRTSANDTLEELQRKQSAVGALNVQISNLPNKETSTFSHLDSFGTGAALVQNPSLFLSTDRRYITIAENNRSELDGAAVSLHIIEIIPDRYRGALKVVEGTNPFSEKITIQHNGEFGANTKDLYYEWWIRDAGPLDLIANEIGDDGSLAEVGSSGQTLWQQYLPKDRASDDSLTENQKRQGLHSIVFEGRPDVTLADKLVLMRYRHKTESDWRLVPFEFTDASSAWANGTQAGAGKEAPFQWAGAANSPQLQADGSKRYIPQLVMGWVKRVLDRINPYEARYNDFFSSESPAVYSSQIQIAGAPFAGAVALNPDKNVIENVGLIELYETVLKRAKDLTIDNSSNAVSTEGVNQAILLAATRLAVLYELLAREAYSDAQDNTITVSDDGGLTNVASFTHAFQNFEPSLLHEELALLRGTDFRKSYPVFNRMFWNFAKGLGEAAYAVNYNIYDENTDGFINEDDARALYPQGHGDSWGHFLSALGMHYELLQQPVFKWSTRSELYSLMENVLEVDYLDEQTFASLAAGKALAGRDIVRNTYRLKYTQDPDGQWQGYQDGTEPARAWGVSEWAHRTGQGAYFDWVVANSILPEEASDATPVINPENLDRIQRSTAVSEIGAIAGGLLEIQQAMDEANSGGNPLGFNSDALAFDLDLSFYEDASGGERRTHFEQVYVRAATASNNALGTLAFATQAENKLRRLSDDTDALITEALRQDIDYRNRLIEIFGRPYDGTIGFGKVYPEGYDGPDTKLYAYIDRNVISEIVPQPLTSTDPDWETANFARIYTEDTLAIQSNEALTGLYGDVWGGQKSNKLTAAFETLVGDNLYRFEPEQDGVILTAPYDFASQYGFKAPSDWGRRTSYGAAQTSLEEMLLAEITLDQAKIDYIGFIQDWEAKTNRLVSQLEIYSEIEGVRDEIDRIRIGINTTLIAMNVVVELLDLYEDRVRKFLKIPATAAPSSVGFSIDVGGVARGISAAADAAATTPSAIAQRVVTHAGAILEMIRDETINNNERNIARLEKVSEFEGMIEELVNLSGADQPKRDDIGMAIQTLEMARQGYVTTLAEGFRLLNEREAFNKILAASVQKNRYQDMVFRLSRNEAMSKYQSAFNHAARYTWLTAKSYDYETSLESGHPAAPGTYLDAIVREKQLGLWVDGEPQSGQGGLAEILANLRDNFQVLKGQLGMMTPQPEASDISLRSELFRINLANYDDEQNQILGASDENWVKALKARIVDDVTQIPEFKRNCRPFTTVDDGPQPGLVIRFSSHIENGRNFFGRPLASGDHTYSTANFATKIRGMAVVLEGYQNSELSNTPRGYLVPVGNDYLRTSSSNGSMTRIWNVHEQRIPTPFTINAANLRSPQFMPDLGGIDGAFGELRRHGDFRFYSGEVEEPDLDSRLIGRSVWNSDWLLVIPGTHLDSDPMNGIKRLTETITDIRLQFSTYSHMGQ